MVSSSCSETARFCTNEIFLAFLLRSVRGLPAKAIVVAPMEGTANAFTEPSVVAVGKTVRRGTSLLGPLSLVCEFSIKLK